MLAQFVLEDPPALRVEGISADVIRGKIQIMRSVKEGKYERKQRAQIKRNGGYRNVVKLCAKVQED
jgi:hypothetical protein